MSITTFTKIQPLYDSGESQNQERRHVETYSGRSGPCNGVFVRKIREAFGRLSASKNAVDALATTLHSEPIYARAILNQQCIADVEPYIE